MMVLTLIDFSLRYFVIGLVTLLVLIQIAKKDDYDYQSMSENLGRFVIFGILGWPYVAVVWVFSWSIWLKKL